MRGGVHSERVNDNDYGRFQDPPQTPLESVKPGEKGGGAIRKFDALAYAPTNTWGIKGADTGGSRYLSSFSPGGNNL